MTDTVDDEVNRTQEFNPEITIAELLRQTLEGQRIIIEQEVERKARYEEARIREEKLIVEQGKTRLANERRSAAVEGVLQDVGLLITTVLELVELNKKIITTYPLADSINELADEVTSSLDRIEDSLLLLLEINRFVLPNMRVIDAEKTTSLIQRIDDIRSGDGERSVKKSIRRQIERLNARMLILMERGATYGVNAPPEIQMEVDEIAEKIEELRKNL